MTNVMRGSYCAAACWCRLTVDQVNNISDTRMLLHLKASLPPHHAARHGASGGGGKQRRAGLHPPPVRASLCPRCAAEPHVTCARGTTAPLLLRMRMSSDATCMHGKHRSCHGHSFNCCTARQRNTSDNTTAPPVMPPPHEPASSMRYYCAPAARRIVTQAPLPACQDVMPWPACQGGRRAAQHSIYSYPSQTVHLLQLQCNGRADDQSTD